MEGRVIITSLVCDCNYKISINTRKIGELNNGNTGSQFNRYFR